MLLRHGFLMGEGEGRAMHFRSSIKRNSRKMVPCFCWSEKTLRNAFKKVRSTSRWVCQCTFHRSWALGDSLKARSRRSVVARYPRFPLPPFDEEWRPRKFLHAEMPRFSSARPHARLRARDIKAWMVKNRIARTRRAGFPQRLVPCFFPRSSLFITSLI